MGIGGESCIGDFMSLNRMKLEYEKGMEWGYKGDVYI